jgi:hypothetical protein
MKPRRIETESRPVVDVEFREYRPPAISTPRRNHTPAPPRVESSPIAARFPHDIETKRPSCLEIHPLPWGIRNAKRR